LRQHDDTTSAAGSADPLVIGVCAAYERAAWSFWNQEAAIVSSTYLGHLALGGAVPLGLIPSEETIAHADDVVARIDGLLLIGGADVDPAFYGAERDPALEATVPLRDRSEIALAKTAMRRGVPVLGICRGLHILNVATGGSLVQHIGEDADRTHRRSPGSLGADTEHGIEVEPRSRLAAAIGAGHHDVNSHHHQAVARVGDGGTVTAVSVGDGIAEAVEWDCSAFAVGVQWHPEVAAPGGIIQHFVSECRAALGAERRTPVMEHN